jgi:hypothetical protein
MPYNVEEITRSALGVYQTACAHCFDGAVFAATAFEQQGSEPLVMELLSNGNDDHHVLAVYTYKKHFGAVAKSNYAGIRFREPVYRTLRELALSYFNNYIAIDGERTLMGYSQIFNLCRATTVDWRSAPREQDLYSDLSLYMDRLRNFRLFPKGFEKVFSRADDRLLRAETLGINLKGVFGAN